MKMYIRICDCCGNTFETDKDKQTVCLFCHRKMLHDFWFWYKYVQETVKQKINKQN